MYYDLNFKDWLLLSVTLSSIWQFKNFIEKRKEKKSKNLKGEGKGWRREKENWPWEQKARALTRAQSLVPWLWGKHAPRAEDPFPPLPAEVAHLSRLQKYTHQAPSRLQSTVWGASLSNSSNLTCSRCLGRKKDWTLLNDHPTVTFSS